MRVMRTQMKRYVDYWRRREAERQMQGRRLACQARADLERIVDALVCQFDALGHTRIGAILQRWRIHYIAKTYCCVQRS